MFFIVLTIFVFVLACIEGKPSEAETHIVGGEEVDIEDYPYQVSMQVSGKHLCGGSIISQTSILTAAHCTDHLYPSLVSIRAGSSTYNSGGVLVKVSDIIQHISFASEIFDFDVAILNLETPLTYGSGIQPIDLARSRPIDDTYAITSGWGYESEFSNISPLHLRAVHVYTVNQEACQSAYFDNIITDQMLCAYRDNADSCYGDSGGPLVVLTSTSYTLIGIVSWGKGCARPGLPGVYSDVSTLWEWIQDNMIPD